MALFLILSECWSVSTDFKEDPSVSVGIYFSLMSLYKGQLNKMWYSFSKLFFTERTVILVSFVDSNFTYSQPQFY